MTDHKIGTRAEWQAARDELAKLEAEHAEQNAEIKRRRLELPWVPVEKKYEFETEAGRRTLARTALRSCAPSASSTTSCSGPTTARRLPRMLEPGGPLDAAALHLGHRDVTLILFSRAPIDRLVAYKRRMDWQLPYVSTYGTDFPFDFGLALTKERARETPEISGILDAPPEWLQDWGKQIGAKLEDGLRENPSWIAFARENGTVYHTYTVSAPDPFVAPYFSFLQERTPKGDDPEPRSWRKDEYPT